jgi:uncharacterized protein (DUF488 family)
VAIFTFGYEGTDIGTFISRLNEARISLVVDVRDMPLSRKRGFSKNALAESLSAAGIQYVHIAALGCPKSIRDKYRENRNWATYCRAFLRHLKKQSAAVARLASLASEITTCLICFEADYNFCHRTFVARAAAQLAQLSVKHLTATATIPDDPLQAAA